MEASRLLPFIIGYLAGSALVFTVVMSWRALVRQVNRRRRSYQPGNWVAQLIWNVLIWLPIRYRTAEEKHIILTHVLLTDHGESTNFVLAAKPTKTGRIRYPKTLSQAARWAKRRDKTSP